MSHGQNNAGLFVYLSAPAPDGGPRFHGGQQLANRIYSCIRAPAVQMSFTAQGRQNTTLGASADLKNLHIAPWNYIYIFNQFTNHTQPACKRIEDLG